MKNIITTLSLAIIAFASWGQQIKNKQTTPKYNLFTDYNATSNKINLLISHDEMNELKNLFMTSGITINDLEYFWQQFDESKKYFPTCKFLDSNTTHSTEYNTSKTTISYRYQYTNVDKNVSFEYSLYVTFNYTEGKPNSLDILFVKAPDNIKRDSGGIYDDFIYTQANNIDQESIIDQESNIDQESIGVYDLIDTRPKK